MEQKRRKHLGLRIPEDVYTGLKALAEKNNRSMNKEVLHIIQCAVERHEVEQLPIDKNMTFCGKLIQNHSKDVK